MMDATTNITPGITCLNMFAFTSIKIPRTKQLNTLNLLRNRLAKDVDAIEMQILNYCNVINRKVFHKLIDVMYQKYCVFNVVL